MKRPTASGGGRLARKAADVQLFVRRVGRKVRGGGLDPNDRNYDRGIEGAVRRMKPEHRDALLREGEDD